MSTPLSCYTIPVYRQDNTRTEAFITQMQNGMYQVVIDRGGTVEIPEPFMTQYGAYMHARLCTDNVQER
jgi:hypothetical protein